MGAADVECAVEMAATTKPRERQFQVVPMPGVFTRGRWKCWDYRDESQPEKKEQILEFEKEKEKIEVTVPDTSTIIVTATTNNPEPLTPVSPDSKESSTIVVTSIAPHLPTPQHGTPQSIGEPSEMERMIQQSQLSHTVAEASSTPGTHVVVSATTANDIHIQQPASVPATPAPQTTSLAPTATAPASVSMARAAEPSPSEEEIANSSTSNGAPSSANIDNKIEQAMDLVKTHLTFAVREEIEVLKQTIAELEQKVAAVESENQLLRQYAPVEIVSNLAALVQQQRAQAGATATAAATAAAPAAVNSNNGASSASVSVVPPTKVTPSFCSSALATTLNNVVADVRQQVRYGQPKEQ